MKGHLDGPTAEAHHVHVEWAQAAAVVGALTAVIGLQTFWIARSLDALREELHRGLDRLDARIDHLEGREPPGLRRI